MAEFGKHAIEITAQTAQFQSEMARAAAAAEGSSRRIGSAFDKLRGSVRNIVGNLGGVLVGAFGASAFVGLIKGSIDAEDHLNDLSKATGIAVETLGGIGFAAQQSGADIDETAKAIQKFQVRMAAAIAGNEEAAKSFALVGLSAKDLKSSTTTDALAKIADKFRSYEGDANKAALGTALFSKSYSGIAPLLDDGGDKLRQNIEYFKKYSGITTETAGKADEFNDTLVKLKLLNGNFARSLTAELLPSLESLANRMVENREKSAGFNQVAADTAVIVKGLAVVALYTVGAFSQLGNAIGAAAAASGAFFSGDLKRAGAILDDYIAQSKKKGEEYAKLRDAILFGNDKGGPKPGVGPAGTGKAPSLGSGDKDAATKKAFDNYIKALERDVSEEKDLLKDREQFLQAYYQDGQIGIKEYFDKRQEILLDARDREVALYTQMIAAAQNFAAKASPKDRLDAEEKVADLEAKRARVQRETAKESVQLFIEQSKASRDFVSAIEDMSIAIANAKGDTVGGGLAAFDKSNAEFKAKAQKQLESLDEFESRQGAIALKLLATNRQITAEQLAMNKATDDFGLILARVGNAQGSLDAQRSAGTLTELEYLAKLSDVNKSQIGNLQRVADAYRAIAEATGDPRALVAAEALTVQIEKLAGETDLVAKKFQDVLANSFADAVVDIVSGTKSIKDAFRDMARSVEQQIARIAANNLADALFKGGGGLSGIGALLGKIFGSLGGGGSAAGIGNLGADFLIPGFAGGTNNAPRGLAWVGERGRELINFRGGEQVIPNNAIKGGEERTISIVNHFTVSGQSSRASQQQVAARAPGCIAFRPRAAPPDGCRRPRCKRSASPTDRASATQCARRASRPSGDRWRMPTTRQHPYRAAQPAPPRSRRSRYPSGKGSAAASRSTSNGACRAAGSTERTGCGRDRWRPPRDRAHVAGGRRPDRYRSSLRAPADDRGGPPAAGRPRSSNLHACRGSPRPRPRPPWQAAHGLRCVRFR